MSDLIIVDRDTLGVRGNVRTVECYGDREVIGSAKGNATGTVMMRNPKLRIYRPHTETWVSTALAEFV